MSDHENRIKHLGSHPGLRTIAACAALLGLAYLAYHVAFENAFYNDDALFLNHAGRALADPARFMNERPLGYFRPVFVAYMAVARAAFGLEPARYFALGIALHGLAAILLWRVARRVLPAPAALAAAATYACFFPHAEAVLWIAAHNTILAVVLALAATIAFQGSIEPGTHSASYLRRILLAGLLAALAVATKEPAIVVLPWIAGVVVSTRGVAALFQRPAMIAGLVVLAMTAAAVLPNARLVGSMSEIAASADDDPDAGTGARAGAGAGARTDAAPAGEFRVQLSAFDPTRVLGAAPWMFSPERHARGELEPWLGAAILLAFATLGIFRKDLRKPVFLGCVLLVSGLIPACLNTQQSANGARHYYFATTGSAVLTGALYAFIAGSRRRPGGDPEKTRALDRARPALAIGALIVLCGAHARSVTNTSRTDYRQISNAQTGLARSLKNPLSTGDELVITEPWIDNRTHLAEFLYLYHGVSDDRVRMMSIGRDKARATFEAMTRNGLRVLDCSQAGPVILWKNVPATRTAAPGIARGIGDLRSPKVRFAKILPP